MKGSKGKKTENDFFTTEYYLRNQFIFLLKTERVFGTKDNITLFVCNAFILLFKLPALLKKKKNHM